MRAAGCEHQPAAVIGEDLRTGVIGAGGPRHEVVFT